MILHRNGMGYLLWLHIKKRGKAYESIPSIISDKIPSSFPLSSRAGQILYTIRIWHRTMNREFSARNLLGQILLPYPTCNFWVLYCRVNLSILQKSVRVIHKWVFISSLDLARLTLRKLESGTPLKEDVQTMSVKIVDSGLCFYFLFSLYFTFLFLFLFFSIFRTTQVRVHQLRCHISHKLIV